MFGILIKSKIIFCYWGGFYIGICVRPPPSISQTKRKDFRKIVKRLSKNFGWCLLNLYEIWMKLFGSFLSVFLLNRGEFYFYSSLHWTVRKALTRFVILNIIHWNEFTFPLLFIESITHLTIIREDWFLNIFGYKLKVANRRDFDFLLIVVIKKKWILRLS